MRTTDVFLAFPYLILAIAIASAVGPGLTTVTLALTAVWWPSGLRPPAGHDVGNDGADHQRAADQRAI